MTNNYVKQKNIFENFQGFQTIKKEKSKEQEKKVLFDKILELEKYADDIISHSTIQGPPWLNAWNSVTLSEPFLFMWVQLEVI